ncbi:MAG: hypothetical protein QOJ79_2195 [Actinomycetota bacterium]|jgi:sugar lactone lactonase YvrE|nr:hypothetical protein [Actinomycetota bacterium]
MNRCVARLRPPLSRLLIAAAVLTPLVAPSPSGAADKYRSEVAAPSVFAEIADPGHPFGLLATEDAVYVATSKGSPFRPGGEEVVLRYPTAGGSPTARATVMTMPTMGLHDMAADGNGRVYVVDMNSRILRFTPTRNGLGTPEVYAAVPEPYASAGWAASMWQNLAFDTDGSLYVSDASLGAIWRIPPNGKPAMWFQSPALLSSQLSGVNGLAISPDHQLYLVLAGSPAPDTFANTVVYRLPLGPTPAQDQLRLVHAFPIAPGSQPTPFPIGADLAFARSGNLYVTLAGSDQVAGLRPDGTELPRITSPLLDVPIGMKFQGTSLLVASSNYFPPENSGHWKVVRVPVGEEGLPLLRPQLPR